KGGAVHAQAQVVEFASHRLAGLSDVASEQGLGHAVDRLRYFRVGQVAVRGLPRLLELAGQRRGVLLVLLRDLAEQQQPTPQVERRVRGASRRLSRSRLRRQQQQQGGSLRA